MTEVIFAKVSEIKENEIFSKRFGRTRIALCRVGDDFFAFHDKCTHANVELSGGEICGKEVTCPLHGAKFDIETGAVLGPPAFSPLKTYKVHIENDYIKVNLD